MAQYSLALPSSAASAIADPRQAPGRLAISAGTVVEHSAPEDPTPSLDCMIGSRGASTAETMIATGSGMGMAASVALAGCQAISAREAAGRLAGPVGMADERPGGRR